MLTALGWVSLDVFDFHFQSDKVRERDQKSRTTVYRRNGGPQSAAQDARLVGAVSSREINTCFDDIAAGNRG